MMLLPFLVTGLSVQAGFLASAVVTAATFFAIGVAKGRVLATSVVRSGLETLASGGVAAVVAYAIAAWLRQAIGVTP